MFTEIRHYFIIKTLKFSSKYSPGYTLDFCAPTLFQLRTSTDALTITANFFLEQLRGLIRHQSFYRGVNDSCCHVLVCTEPDSICNSVKNKKIKKNKCDVSTRRQTHITTTGKHNSSCRTKGHTVPLPAAASSRVTCQARPAANSGS